MFYRHQVPIAYSMIELVRQSALHAYEPFQEFMCYWMAFNNIYTTLSDNVGRRRELARSKDGTVKTRVVGGVILPKVEGPSEQEQLDIAFRHFDEELKRKLIMHNCTRFFVYRSPKWRGRAIQLDGRGQRLNGVLNVGYTINSDSPVWSPINTAHYEQYVRGSYDAEIQNSLAKEILTVLYTVRCNTFHGGKRIDDSNDRNVIRQATPLLILIVNYFLSET